MNSTLSSHSAVAHQFDDLEQQNQADDLGMWLFLATELLFFGGVFLVYTVYRHLYEATFAAGSLEMNLVLGTLNTALLLTSSLTMALAVHAAEKGYGRALGGYLCVTIALAVTFVAIKFSEYHEKALHHLMPLFGASFKWPHPDPGHAEVFFSLYFVMTGMHAFHMVIGVVLMVLLLIQALRGGLLKEYSSPVRITGLYWHFVDVVWVFLFPLFYLVGMRMSSTKFSQVATYGVVYVCLLLLLGLTVEASRHDLGAWNFPVTILIATTKAVLIGGVFMHVWHSPAILKLMIGASLGWLAVMFSLSATDYVTRTWDRDNERLPAVTEASSSSRGE